jgi:hypothetical protein
VQNSIRIPLAPLVFHAEAPLDPNQTSVLISYQDVTLFVVPIDSAVITESHNYIESSDPS